MAVVNRTGYGSTVFLVNRTTGSAVMGIGFANDTIAAAMTANTLYLYNEGIGYTIDTKSGEAVRNRLTLDNYRGFYTYKGSYYLQTTGTIFQIRKNGGIAAAHACIQRHGLWMCSAMIKNMPLFRGNSLNSSAGSFRGASAPLHKQVCHCCNYDQYNDYGNIQ